MKLVFKKQAYLFSLVVGIILLYSCSNSTVENYYLIVGKDANNVELSTINDLKKDLEKVVEANVSIISEKEKLPQKGNFFIVGSIESNSLLKKLAEQKKINLSTKIPGSRGGIWSKTTLSKWEKCCCNWRVRCTRLSICYVRLFKGGFRNRSIRILD